MLLRCCTSANWKWGCAYIVLDASLDSAQRGSQGLHGSKTLTSCHANLGVNTVLTCVLLHTTLQGKMAA